MECNIDQDAIFFTHSEMLVKISANIAFLFYKEIYMKYLILYYKYIYIYQLKSLEY
jgi:hypothetical protein